MSEGSCRERGEVPYVQPNCSAGAILLSRAVGWSIPLSLILSPGSFFCPGSALGRHLMGLDKEQVGQSNNAQWQGPAKMSSA